MTELPSVVELPSIPEEAPDWVRALPSSGRFVDTTKFYDVTGHLLFDSLLNANGIRHFFYFFSTDKQAERVLKRLHGLSTSPPSRESITEENREEVQVAFHLGDSICGHRGIVHGGLTATMIDEVCGAAVYSYCGPCLTANLTVDYVKPLYSPAWVLVRAHVERHDGRKICVSATVENGEGDVYAKGTSLFIKPRGSVQDILKRN